MKVFDKHMSQEEELEFFKKYKQGDKGASEILILRNMRLVAHIVKKYNQGERNVEDMISVGTIGLIKAVQTFDYTKGARFSTYGAKCIENELLMMLRNEKKVAKDVSIYEPIGTDKEGNEINLIDVIVLDNEECLDDMIKEEDFVELYEGIGTVLEEREKEIICMRYGLFGNKTKTQKEIATDMNISRSYVSRIEKKALAKLLKFFIECDKFSVGNE